MGGSLRDDNVFTRCLPGRERRAEMVGGASLAEGGNMRRVQNRTSVLKFLESDHGTWLEIKNPKPFLWDFYPPDSPQGPDYRALLLMKEVSAMNLCEFVKCQHSARQESKPPRSPGSIP